MARKRARNCRKSGGREEEGRKMRPLSFAFAAAAVAPFIV